MWAQIVGKFRLAATPWICHFWHAAFYVNARGLTTSLIPGQNADYEAQFDFIDHTLTVASTDGRRETLSDTRRTLWLALVFEYRQPIIRVVRLERQ